MLKTILFAGAAMALVLSSAPSPAKELKSIGISLGSLGNPFFVALSKGADFEIRVVGWLGAPPSAKALPIPPELARMPAGRVQCIYGSDDANGSACPGLAGTAADVVRLPGGHHFGGDYEGLTRRILAAWRARIG